VDTAGSGVADDANVDSLARGRPRHPGLLRRKNRLAFVEIGAWSNRNRRRLCGALFCPRLPAVLAGSPTSTALWSSR